MRKKKVGDRTLRIESYVKDRPRHMFKEVKDPSSSDNKGYMVGNKETAYSINPELVRRKAYEAYMLHFASKDELLKLGMPETTLDTWLYQPTEGRLSWKMQRDHYYEVELRAFMEAKSEQLKKTAARILNIAGRSLEKIDEDGEALSVAQVEKLFNSFGKVQHWIQIEDGKPTNITETFNYTQEGLRNLMKELQDLDPLIDYDPSGKIN